VFVIKQRTGFTPYYFYGWENPGGGDRFIVRRDLARRFETEEQARSVIKLIETRRLARYGITNPPVPLQVEKL